MDTTKVGYLVAACVCMSMGCGEGTEVRRTAHSPSAKAAGPGSDMSSGEPAMTLEFGPSADAMHTVYARDPYDFNDQRIDAMDMVLEQGQHARLTCNYKNTRQDMVTYGESTFDEMCFLIMFAVGTPTACILGSAPLVQ